MQRLNNLVVISIWIIQYVQLIGLSAAIERGDRDSEVRGASTSSNICGAICEPLR